MSGIEIFALAATIVQIADLGARVSVKLFGFARRVRSAAERIDTISKDIAATGALLQQLGAQLERDHQSHLIRTEVLDRAHVLVEECKKLFQSIDKAIDGNSGSKIILSLKQKIQYASIESDIDALGLNLEHLKSSIGIMQNVLIYAEQLQNRDQVYLLKEQQDLLKALAEEKVANEKRYKDLLLAIQERPQHLLTKIIDAEPNLHTNFQSKDGAFLEDGNSNDAQTSHPDNAQQITLNNLELREYNNPVAHLLDSIHSRRYNLCPTLRQKIQVGVLTLHWEHWAPLRKHHDDRILLAVFKDVQQVARFWTHKINFEGAQKAEEKLASAGVRTPVEVLRARRERETRRKQQQELSDQKRDEELALEAGRPLHGPFTYSWKPIHIRDGHYMTQFKLKDVSTMTLDSFDLAWEPDKVGRRSNEPNSLISSRLQGTEG